MTRLLRVAGAILLATVAVVGVYLVQASPRNREPFFASPAAFAEFFAVALLTVSFLAAIYWLMFLGMTRSHRRAREGLCLHCGYSLRGNVSGVCPECGTPR